MDGKLKRVNGCSEYVGVEDACQEVDSLKASCEATGGPVGGEWNVVETDAEDLKTCGGGA